jgi:hypothetical protein
VNRSKPGQPAQPAGAAVKQALWNPGMGPNRYPGGAEKYQEAVLEQYKLYVEHTERVANRRSALNMFFLTLNGLVLSAVGVFWRDRPAGLLAWWLVFPLAVALAECAVWYGLVSLYRGLSRAKWAVVAAFEEELPARAFVESEWHTLVRPGQGRGRRWRSLTGLEQTVPVLFAAAYLAAAVLAVCTAR